MRFSQAVGVCAAWIGAALLFNAWVFFYQGQQKALEFFTGYVIELSLSIDNLFVFFLIFSHFKVDSTQQNKILSLGVLGAQLMRAVFVLGGVALLRHLSWVVYAFGVLLVFSGFKIFFKKNKSGDLRQNILLRFLNKLIPKKISIFFVVLVAIETVDLLFAVDSIPAVLAITKDPFIVYTSNIFAVLGLRSMYFILSPVIDKFRYLHYTLGIILVFVGAKMLTDHIWHMPIGYALGFIVIVLVVFSTISVYINVNGKSK